MVSLPQLAERWDCRHEHHIWLSIYTFWSNLSGYIWQCDAHIRCQPWSMGVLEVFVKHQENITMDLNLSFVLSSCHDFKDALALS